MPAISMTGLLPGVTSRGSHAQPSRVETPSLFVAVCDVRGWTGLRTQDPRGPG